MDYEQLTQKIKRRYIRYLGATFHFKDEHLRCSFHKALEDYDLSKGPFYEPDRSFKQGSRASVLARELLGEQVDEGFLASLIKDPLYQHQEQAIRNVVGEKRNIVVATGTASGKTETFLYPILFDLYREFQQGTLEQPGVRALIIYPMNALAHDQRGRLGGIAQSLRDEGSQFNFTFGQYIGATPEDNRDSCRNVTDRLAERLEGELVLRKEMREKPPHILITNYSMLEYLLIRPDDSPLFDDDSAKFWKFLVLDEAHQYRGVQGMEIAMLIRRLKQRLRKGGRGEQPFQCIATSATIAREEDKEGVKEFARVLFDDEFESSDIIFGQNIESQKVGRSHSFFCSLEGAYLRYVGDNASEIILNRDSGPEANAFFELALCRECGQHYFVGDVRDGKLEEAIRDPGDPKFNADFFLPIEQDQGIENAKKLKLCKTCGELAPELSCQHKTFLYVKKEDKGNEKDRAKKCSVCEYGYRDPIREITYGTDGPNVVIATTLHRFLREGKKKVLAFSDSRQEAAFFAWYVHDSYQSIRDRNLLYRVLKGVSTTNALSLQELFDEMVELCKELGVFGESKGPRDSNKQVWIMLYRELLTAEQRLSLEGVGIVRYSVKWPKRFQIPQALLKAPWDFSEEEARNLIFMLLNFMRQERAMDLRYSDDTSPLKWSDLDLYPQQAFRVGKPDVGRYIKSWDGDRGRFVEYLARILGRKNYPESDRKRKAQGVLREIWDAFRQDDQLLRSANGDGRELNPDWWRVELLRESDIIFECGSCARLQSMSIEGVCFRKGCRGNLKEIVRSEINKNHYRLLYEDEGMPIQLRSEEHTAQINNDTARDFQKKFKNGEIDILSTSTTFEVGVDLGDLDTVFMRNVPPETFNYTQRAGRAGRRDDPGFAITFCRRNPHDLYHYQNPKERILKGVIHPPVINICNEKIILRHITAVAFSYFFRAHGDRFKNVCHFLGDGKEEFLLEKPAGCRDFRNFILNNKNEIRLDLERIIPKEMQENLGIGNENWIHRIVGEEQNQESRFVLAEREVKSDCTELRKIADEHYDNRKGKEGDRIIGRIKTINKEDVLSFLSRKAVIPKYGFPVDVVGLELTSPYAKNVSLQRDLSIAIAEFAPGSKLTANKKEWESNALKRVSGKEWDIRYYQYCDTHKRFESDLISSSNLPPKCCPKMKSLRYIDPQFGFISSKEPKEPQGRSRRLFTTRPYFLGFTEQRDPESIEKNGIKITQALPGKLVVLCEGDKGGGFWICEACGRGDKKFDPVHTTPWGLKCSGSINRFSLGHEFLTDVVSMGFPNLEREDEWFPYSLAYALIAGASNVLDIPANDLNTTISGKAPQIILYDDVPGGAGLVARLTEENVLKDVLQAALERVEGGCQCGEQDSCYGCLRSYRNQFVHPHLHRGSVKNYLEKALHKF